MRELNVPERPRPSWLPGALIGVATGLLLSWIWWYGAWDVALAVTFVFAGLVAAVLAGAPGWRSFATGLLVAAAVTGAAVVLLTG
ncbi:MULTISPECIES: hypothetical protein [unclassified Nocardioides]|uniref:hypothetical protein n=1 Tax=Nocardioides sp. URHA0032 TaxID=1380388 RepID=UPI00048D644F|nr:hypothetical protein [Nocardioides sp. URHA0032]